MLRLVFASILLALVELAPVARGAEEAPRTLAVRTADGRELVGAVDGRSDEATLWLRREESGIALSTPVAWGDVVEASFEGEVVDVADVRERRGELQSSAPSLGAVIGATPQAAVVQAAYLAPRGGRVRNLEVAAAGLVNLDRDVEPDGIAVTVVAVGFDGAPVAVRGTLRAELHGERRSVNDPAPRFELFGRWTKRVQSEDFVDGAATYCLPFRQVAPEWEFDVMPDAVVSVQLSAAGHGNYAASAPVAVRAFNPLRDELQQLGGTRFLPNEIRGERRYEGRPGMWLWWGR